MKQTVDVKVPASVVLNENDRLHWAQKGDRAAQIRMLGKLAGRRMYAVPKGKRVRITIAVWKGHGGIYDPPNLGPTAKAIVDGLQDAGVLTEGDDWRHVEGPHLEHGGVNPALKGRTRRGGHVVFTVTLEGIGGAL